MDLFHVYLTHIESNCYFIALFNEFTLIASRILNVVKYFVAAKDILF